jgi:hypothetical protein
VSHGLDDAVVVAFGAVVVVAITILLRLAGGLERRCSRRRVRCPEVGRVAECLVEQDTATGRWVAVAQCSLQPGRRPRCRQACVTLIEHGYVE